MLWECVGAYFKEPHDVVGFSVPFSGNLYGALKSAQWIRQNHPNTKIIMGGGYVNTELRDLRDPRVFDYLDYILVDDGEGPLLALLDHLKQGGALKRTFCREHGAVVYHSGSMLGEPGHNNLPAPDYSGLRLTEYLSMFDNPNPMHRLWNDGRWNKLTVAHGCYWKRCSFCDISLDYIGRYENSQAATFVDKMEALIRQTGETGFHFVDEAAPPLALRDIALEIIRRGLQVTWWTNIRFEKTFTPDLCRVLSISGCIAVTGGLEVASDRLLALMEKGVTIEQVARVCKGFTDAGILVHAYLMYGFPTQTEQETIDSLEVVRQLFENQLIQSGFWHRFAMTAHSPVGKHPEAYQVICTGPEFEGFANNDLYHEDPTGADHELYGSGLTAALYNYLHGNALDMDVTDFFDFKVPATTIHKNLIFSHINNFIPDDVRRDDLFVYRYRLHIEVLPFSKREAQVTFTHARGEDQVVMPIEAARYLEELANLPELGSTDRLPLKSMLEGMAECIQKDPAEMVLEPWWRQLRKSVLLVLRF
jgi:hypothetical protein